MLYVIQSLSVTMVKNTHWSDMMNIIWHESVLPAVITCTHHQGCTGAVPVLCEVSGWSDAWGTTAQAAVWPHPIQCCHLDPHPCQGELSQVALHVCTLERMLIGSFRTLEAPTVLSSCKIVHNSMPLNAAKNLHHIKSFSLKISLKILWRQVKQICQWGEIIGIVSNAN